jgi:hypothetical protein
VKHPAVLHSLYLQLWAGQSTLLLLLLLLLGDGLF